jgi:Protein of unknown function (DUF4231)
MDQQQRNINRRQQTRMREIDDTIKYLPAFRLSRRLTKAAHRDKEFFRTALPKERYIYEIMLRITIDSSEAKTKLRVHRTLQFISVIGAALVTIFVGLPTDLSFPKVILVILSGIVTIATIVINLLRYGEQSRDLYHIALAMQKELDNFKNKEGEYAHTDDNSALNTFKKRTSALNYDRVLKYISIMDASPKK